jgi:hypothetical protein
MTPLRSGSAFMYVVKRGPLSLLLYSITYSITLVYIRALFSVNAGQCNDEVGISTIRVFVALIDSMPTDCMRGSGEDAVEGEKVTIAATTVVLRIV